MVALEFDLDVIFEGVFCAVFVNHHGVVYDEINRHQWIDALRIAAESGHGLSHCGQVDDGGNAGEILHQYACRTIGDFAVGFFIIEPRFKGLNVIRDDRAAIFEAEQILQQNF